MSGHIVRADMLAARLFVQLSTKYHPSYAATEAIDAARIFVAKLAQYDPLTCAPLHAGLPSDHNDDEGES